MGDMANFIVFLGVFIVIFLIIALPFIIFLLIAVWKVYKKAGKNGWEALIPFYSQWTLVQVCELKYWFFLIVCAGSIVSFLGLVGLSSLAGIASVGGYFFCHYNLAKKFGKEPVGYGIGLTLLPIVFYPILAFSKDAVFNPDIKVSSFGPIEEDKVNNYTSGNSSSTTNSSGAAEEAKTTGKRTTKDKFCKNCGNAVNGDKFCTKCGVEIK